MRISLELRTVVFSWFGTLAACSSPPVRERPFQEIVLEVVREYPTDGSFAYWWPKEGSWEGTTQDLVYEGRKLCSGDPQRRSYCCGLTYEVFFRAYERFCAERKRPFRIGNLSGDDLHELRLRWFGDSKTGERRKLVQAALVSMGLGTAVERFEDARPGDFVQFWRHSGSGHSAVFIDWVRDKDKIAGLTYWSSQSSTRGIGYRTESIGEREGIKADEIFLVRAIPRD